MTLTDPSKHSHLKILRYPPWTDPASASGLGTLILRDRGVSVSAAERYRGQEPLFEAEVDGLVQISRPVKLLPVADETLVSFF